MSKREKFHTIWLIMKERYPLFCPIEEPDSKIDFDDHFNEMRDNIAKLDEDDERIGEFDAAQHHVEILVGKSAEKLDEIYDKIIEDSTKNHPLNQKDYLSTDETYKQWLGYGYLEIREAAALRIGRDPEKIDELIDNEDLGTDSVRAKFKETYRVLSRLPISENVGRIVPKEFIEWIKQYDSQQAKIIEANYSSEKQNPDDRLSSATTKEAKTMEKIIIGLAMAKYQYRLDDKKSPSPKNMSDAVLRETGSKITPETIRKYLERAKKHIHE